ncbi:MAG: succinate dehydrogenase assembly factor 2, partial [Rhodospirillaceae bacterium]|nr:succinate dehydrogenase assembly factor 2 [Rhodospirillaceae bacterium]
MTEHNKNIAAVRRRLNFRSWHRGTKELDLLFGPF